jgi:hypothetical protein
MAYSDHPSWRAHFLNQNQYQTKRVPYDQGKEQHPIVDQFMHEMGMIKDILITLMNLMDQHKELLDEHNDMLDLIMANLIEE